MCCGPASTSRAGTPLVYRGLDVSGEVGVVALAGTGLTMMLRGAVLEAGAAVGKSLGAGVWAWAENELASPSRAVAKRYSTFIIERLSQEGVGRPDVSRPGSYQLLRMRD